MIDYHSDDSLKVHNSITQSKIHVAGYKFAAKHAKNLSVCHMHSKVTSPLCVHAHMKRCIIANAIARKSEYTSKV